MQAMLSGTTVMGISTVDFHTPSAMIGWGLESHLYTLYVNIKAEVKACLHAGSNSTALVSVLDSVERCKKTAGVAGSIRVLVDVMEYLRGKLVETVPSRSYCVLLLVDFLVKNAGYQLHVAVGREAVMKTINKVVRRHWHRAAQLGSGRGYNTRAQLSSPDGKAADFGIDCIQAWGEAFTRRQEQYPAMRNMYPHIISTYNKFKHGKYAAEGVRFSRPDFDHTRVPIFFSVATAQEQQLAKQYCNSSSSSSADYHMPASGRSNPHKGQSMLRTSTSFGEGWQELPDDMSVPTTTEWSTGNRDSSSSSSSRSAKTGAGAAAHTKETAANYSRSRVTTTIEPSPNKDKAIGGRDNNKVKRAGGGDAKDQQGDRNKEQKQGDPLSPNLIDFGDPNYLEDDTTTNTNTNSDTTSFSRSILGFGSSSTDFTVDVTDRSNSISSYSMNSSLNSQLLLPPPVPAWPPTAISWNDAADDTGTYLSSTAKDRDTPPSQALVLANSSMSFPLLNKQQQQQQQGKEGDSDSCSALVPHQIQSGVVGRVGSDLGGGGGGGEGGEGGGGVVGGWWLTSAQNVRTKEQHEKEWELQRLERQLAQQEQQLRHSQQLDQYQPYDQFQQHHSHSQQPQPQPQPQQQQWPPPHSAIQFRQQQKEQNILQRQYMLSSNSSSNNSSRSSTNNRSSSSSTSSASSLYPYPQRLISASTAARLRHVSSSSGGDGSSSSSMGKAAAVGGSVRGSSSEYKQQQQQQAVSFASLEEDISQQMRAVSLPLKPLDKPLHNNTKTEGGPLTTIAESSSTSSSNFSSSSITVPRPMSVGDGRGSGRSGLGTQPVLPSSDPNVEIVYFGNTRVVRRK